MYPRTCPFGVRKQTPTRTHLGFCKQVLVKRLPRKLHVRTTSATLARTPVLCHVTPPKHPLSSPPSFRPLSLLKVTLLVVYNSSYSVALYGLLMFYKACGPLLAPFRPLQKFFAVKSIIFATYWQSVVIHFIPGVSERVEGYWDMA